VGEAGDERNHDRAHDLQIAAIALRHGFSVATLNVEEFRRVPSLPLADLQPFLIHEK
jgi:predicted nucleic acid-binding protein